MQRAVPAHEQRRRTPPDPALREAPAGTSPERPAGPRSGRGGNGAAGLILVTYLRLPLLAGGGYSGTGNARTSLLPFWPACMRETFSRSTSSTRMTACSGR